MLILVLGGDNVREAQQDRNTQLQQRVRQSARETLLPRGQSAAEEDVGDAEDQVDG